MGEGVKPMPITPGFTGVATGPTQPVTGSAEGSPFADATTFGYHMDPGTVSTYAKQGTGFTDKLLPKAGGDTLIDEESVLPQDDSAYKKSVQMPPVTQQDSEFKSVAELHPGVFVPIGSNKSNNGETSTSTPKEQITENSTRKGVLGAITGAVKGAAENVKEVLSGSRRVTVPEIKQPKKKANTVSDNQPKLSGRKASAKIFPAGAIYMPAETPQALGKEGKGQSKIASIASATPVGFSKDGTAVSVAKAQGVQAGGSQQPQQPQQPQAPQTPQQPPQAPLQPKVPQQQQQPPKRKAQGVSAGQGQNTGSNASPVQANRGATPIAASPVPKVTQPQPQAARGASGAPGYSSFNNPKSGKGNAHPVSGQPQSGKGNARPVSGNPNTPPVAPVTPPVAPNIPPVPPVTPPAAPVTPNHQPAGANVSLKDEIGNRARARAQARGSKALGSTEEIYMVASDGLGKEEIKKEATSIAFASIRKYDDDLKAAQAQKAQAKANTAFGKFLAKHKALSVGWGVAKLPVTIPKAILTKTSSTIKRTVTLKNYYDTARATIEASGDRSYGKFAVDRMADYGKLRGAGKERERIVEAAKFFKEHREDTGHDWHEVFNTLKSDEEVAKQAISDKGFIDPDKAILERAKQARRGQVMGFDSDTGIALESMEADNPVAKALREFAREVADYDLSVDNDPDTSQAAFDREAREMQRRDNARQKVIDVINKEMGGSMNNAIEAVRLIERNLSGVLHAELQDPAKHDEALQAIDAYMDEHFHLDKFKVTKSGLVASEIDYAKTADKMALKWGVFAGIAVALGSSYATGLSKNFIIQHVTDSQVVMAGLKVFAAAGLGAARAISKTKAEQMKDNIDAALGLEVKENKGVFGTKFLKNERRNFDAIMLDVDATTQQLLQGLENLGSGANMNQTVRDSLIKQIGEIYAREQLETQKKGKIKTNLFKYRGRENIERDRANMYRAINDIVAHLQANGIDAVKLIEQSQKSAYATLNEAYKSIRNDQLSERYKNGARDGAIAGVAALGAIIATDVFFKNGRLMAEAKALRRGEKKLTFKHGLKVVDVEKTGQAAGTAGMAERAMNQQRQAVNQAKAGTAESNGNTGPIKGGEAGANKGGNVGNKDPHFEENSKSQLLIEDDPEGGQAIGFDRNGNGKIDADEYLVGKGNESGVNLNSETEIADLNGRLKSYGMEVTRDPSVGEKIVPVKVSDYVNGQSNAVKGMNINNVNWNKSQQLCSIEKEIVVHPGDGAEIYDVTIDGKIPDGAKLYIDLDGDGPAAPLEYTITDGHAFVPASVLDVRTGGTAGFMGTVRVARIEDGQFISYTTNIGKSVSAEDMINSRVEETGSILSVVKQGDGAGSKDVVINQTAINGEGHTVANLSETFDGRPSAGTVNRVPYMLQEKVPAAGTTAEVVKLENGAEIPNWEYKGGYKENFDSSLNYMFKEKASYVGTPMILDANGDGVIDATESAAYIDQMFVRTATNPYVLAQNASAYGLLDTNNINNIFSQDELVKLGILDGKIDDMDELNLLIENLKLSGNSDLYDRLVNRTLEKMRNELSGAKLEMIDLGARKATYLNNNTDLDLINASRTRKAVTFYREVDGERVYIGNGGMMGDGKRPTYDILACEQKGQKLRSEGSETSENSETSEDSEASEGQEGTGSEDSENTENSENTETSEDSEGSEGQESTGSEDSESTESSENSETSEGQESTGSENSEDSEGTEGTEDSENSENSETTETSEDSEGSEGQESTGSEDSENTESSESSETSEELEDVKQPPIGMEPDPVPGQPEPIITPSPDPGVPETPEPIFEGGGTIVDDGAAIPTMDENLEEYYRLIGKKQ